MGIIKRFYVHGSEWSVSIFNSEEGRDLHNWLFKHIIKLQLCQNGKNEKSIDQCKSLLYLKDIQINEFTRGSFLMAVTKCLTMSTFERRKVFIVTHGWIRMVAGAGTGAALSGSRDHAHPVGWCPLH